MDSADAGAGPLIERSKDACTECWACVRACPVRAIRVSNGRSEVIQERCIACGLCVHACARGGHVVRNDVPSVLELLAGTRPVVALLASEFVPALHPMTPPRIEEALGALGFSSIETTLLGEELVAEEYERLHARDDSLLTLRSTCPVAVDYVRKFHPALVGALAPVVAPYIAQARLIREVYEDDVAIVYVSPCYARKDEFRDPELAGAVDAVIDFTELRAMIESAEPRARRSSATRCATRPRVLKEISLTDGFPRQTVVLRDPTDSSVRAVRGIAEIDRSLRAVEAGESCPPIIDMLACEGCLDGPAVSPGLSVFAKRNIESAERLRPGATYASTRALLRVLPSVTTVRSFSAQPLEAAVPSEEETLASLTAVGLAGENALDCGACGWKTCAEHAAAVINAESSWELCMPLQRKHLGELGAELAGVREAALPALDPVTGLWNRRPFAERLAIELERHARYGSPLSIILAAFDGGDDAAEPLEAVAGVMVAHLRSTDFAARTASDRIAVILPGIGKTAAFAVAEKLRQAVGATSTPAGDGGYTRPVGVRASFGVAAQATGDARQLLEAADLALNEAMDAGGDRVHIAPG